MGGRVGQGAGGDVIHADVPQGRDLFPRHVAGALRFGPAGDEGHGLLHGIRVHIVEHDDVGPSLHGFAHLVQGLGLHLDLAHKGRIGAGPGHRLADAAGGADVVVLEHDAVGQVVAVVRAAAHGDGVFFKNAHVGRRFAGIQQRDAGALQQMRRL